MIHHQRLKRNTSKGHLNGAAMAETQNGFPPCCELHQIHALLYAFPDVCVFKGHPFQICGILHSTWSRIYSNLSFSPFTGTSWQIIKTLYPAA